MDEIELKIGAPFADEGKLVALALSVEAWRQIGPAPGQQEAVYPVEETATLRGTGHKGKDEGNAAEFFDRTNVPRAQEIGGLMPPPFFPVTGIKVWSDADDRFHCLANGLHGRSSSLSRGLRIGNSEKPDGFVA